MDPNISLVFETIGQIKKSLQCSICLELLNDPHSTRCNHQFCSNCIRKVVDDRRNKQKEALCPLCKNPITKRSLTANPRLKEIVIVVQRLNETFKKDASLPDSPYPLVNLRPQQQSESYLQFLNSHPTPEKPVKYKSPSVVSVNDETQLVNRNQSTGEKPKGDNDSKSTSAQSRDTGAEILALLETDEIGELPPRSKDADLSNSNENPRKNHETCDIAKVGTSLPSDEQISSCAENRNSGNLQASSSSTTEIIKYSQSSSLTCNSVSILESLVLSQSKDDFFVDPNEQTDVQEAVCEFDGEEACVNLNKEDTALPLNNRYTDGENDIYKPEYSSGNLKENGLNTTTVLEPTNDVQKIGNASCDLSRTCGRTNSIENGVEKDVGGRCSPVSFVKRQVVDEAVLQAYSNELVPASMESNSGSYGILHIPRFHDLLADDKIACRVLNPDAKLDQNDHCPTEIVNYSPVKNTTQKDVAETELKTKATYIEQNIHAPSSRTLSDPSSDKCDGSEALFVSPSTSSLSVHCHSAKRKCDDEDTCTNNSRKCRRLNENKDSASPIYEKEIKNGMPEENRDGDSSDKFYDSKTKTCNNYIKSEKDVIDVMDHKQPYCSSLDVCDQSINDELNTNLNTKSQQKSQTVKSSENNTEDEIIPPTPPRNVDNSRNDVTSQSGNRELKEPTVTENCVENQVFHLDNSLNGRVDNEEEEMVISDKSPVENHISSSQEDLLFKDDEPCDYDNIGLLRRLAPALTNLKEGESESDEEISDCKTTDTTSVSSLTDGDCMEVSSQRIQYLHQVLAETGGEIEKLTADLKTLRKSDISNQPIESVIDDEVDSEKGEDDDERQSCVSLSPPPSLEPSALSLTKLPSAIQDMQMLLQQDSDSDDDTASTHCDRLDSNLRGSNDRLKTHFPKTSFSNTNVNTMHGEHLITANCPTKVANVAKKNTEKENDLDSLKRPDKGITIKHHEKSSEKVLAELRMNASPKSNILASNHRGVKDETVEKSSSFGRPPVSFVVTRLPKQFVVSTVVIPHCTLTGHFNDDIFTYIQFILLTCI